MRSFGIFAMIILMVFGCVSCGNEETDIASLMLEICDACGGEYGKGVLYLDRARDTGNAVFSVLSGEELGFLYSGKKEVPPCFGRINGYAVRLPLDGSGYEIHIISCLSPSDADEIEQMLLARVEKLQNAEILQYAPEEYELYFRGAEVMTSGRLVFLLATPDNSAAKEAIRAF